MLRRHAKKLEKFKNLPVEILVQIFEYLNVADRLVAGLACKTWFDVSNHSKFLNETDTLILSREQTVDIFSLLPFTPCMLKLYSASTRNLKNFYIFHCDLDDVNAKLFWAKMAKHLTFLNLNKCKVKSSSLVNALKFAPQLTTLELDVIGLDVTDSWILKDFQKLKNNNNIKNFRWVDSDSFIKDDVFVALMQGFDGLESIVLAAKPLLERLNNADFVTETLTACMMQQFFAGEKRKEVKVENVVKVLKKHGKTLKKLVLDEQKNWDRKYIPSFLAAKIPMNLEHLELKNSTSTKDTVNLNKFLSTQKHLKTLVLKHVVFDQKTLEIIFTMVDLEDLQLVAVAGHDNFDLELRAMKNLKKLKKLYLSDFVHLTNKGFNVSMVHDLSQIKSIAIHNMPRVTEKTFGKLLQKTHDLRKLVLINCPNITTDKNLQILFEHCTRLEFLQLCESKKITVQGFVNTFRINRLTSLKRLELRSLENLTDGCLQNMNSKVLRTFYYAKCDKVTIGGLGALMRQSPSLEVLQVPDECTAYLAHVIGEQSMTRRIDISIVE